MGGAWKKKHTVKEILVPKKSSAVIQFHQISVQEAYFISGLSTSVSTPQFRRFGWGGSSEWVEHANTIWHLLQTDKKEKDLLVILLDLVNTFLLLCKMFQRLVPCQAVETEGWGWEVRVCPGEVGEVHHKASQAGGC